MPPPPISYARVFRFELNNWFDRPLRRERKKTMGTDTTWLLTISLIRRNLVLVNPGSSANPVRSCVASFAEGYQRCFFFGGNIVLSICKVLMMYDGTAEPQRNATRRKRDARDSSIGAFYIPNTRSGSGTTSHDLRTTNRPAKKKKLEIHAARTYQAMPHHKD